MRHGEFSQSTAGVSPHVHFDRLGFFDTHRLEEFFQSLRRFGSFLALLGLSRHRRRRFCRLNGRDHRGGIHLNYRLLVDILRRKMDGRISDFVRVGIAAEAELSSVTRISESSALGNGLRHFEEAPAKGVISKEAMGIGLPDELLRRIRFVGINPAADAGGLVIQVDNLRIEFSFGMMEPEPENTVFRIQVGVVAAVLAGIHADEVGRIEAFYCGKYHSIRITKVLSYPQAFAAAVTKYGSLKSHSSAYIIDIGGFTIDVLKLRYGRPDLAVVESFEKGVITLYNSIASKCNSQFDRLLEDSDIDEVILNKPTILPGEVQMLIRDMTADFLHEFYSFLRERGIDVNTSKCVFAGGGSLLLRGMIEREQTVGFSIFIDDIHANALGYEILYRSEVGANAG